MTGIMTSRTGLKPRSLAKVALEEFTCCRLQTEMQEKTSLSKLGRMWERRSKISTQGHIYNRSARMTAPGSIGIAASITPRSKCSIHWHFRPCVVFLIGNGNFSGIPITLRQL